ncbi:D-Ala-D-Ala carboxypeptidase family metallohydrolase [Pseudomonas alvandae]|uniref:D-Ala-D-Ala carboxypeptidase family metallohydrolase n=1 Tax=Pseudomonas TaxID=286 RepID=UPI00389A2C78
MTDSPWANFPYAELRCRCGRCDSTGHEMAPHFMDLVQQLRELYGRPMPLSSAYRCPLHPAEANKPAPGEHLDGLAVDVLCRGAEALRLLNLALILGFTRIGVNQKGVSRFLHLGLAPTGRRLPSPTIWSY